MTTWTQWLTTTLSGLATLFTFGAGCLTTQGGCSMNASALAGFSNPAVRMTKGVFGASAEIGTDFTGHGELHYDPDTGQIDVVVDVNSQVSPVVTAEGVRADHLIELRKIEAERIVATHQAIGANIRSVIDGLAMAVAAGGDAASKFLDGAAPILKGSAMALDLGALGGGTLNLGDGAPPPAGRPEP